MSNYQRCNIRMYPKTGCSSPDELLPRVEQLQKEGGIYETIHLIPGDGQRFLEMRFTAKHYPLMLDDIFPLEDFDLWTIKSDEGGGSDRLQLLSSTTEFSTDFDHKALYRFDRIDLVGTTAIRREEVQRVFGHGGASLVASPDGLRHSIDTSGLYSSNGFFYGNDAGEIVVDGGESGSLLALESEFWDMVFHAHGVEFMERFYRPARRSSRRERILEWLLRVDFFCAGRLSNRLEWRQDPYGWQWEHSSDDGFWNLTNPEWCAYRPPKER